MTDFESDERDGVLFRFWIRAGSYPGGFPSETAAAIGGCKTPADYRRALTELAERKRINLPEAVSFASINEAIGAAQRRAADALADRDRLTLALRDVVDGIPAHHLAEQNDPMTIERAREIRKLAGLSEDG